VLSFTLGNNIGSGPNHHDAALLADFQDITAFRSYINGPGHNSYIRTPELS